MTLVVAVKVCDGLVVGADSASTLSLPDQQNPGKVLPYAVSLNALKICCLHHELPIGIASWGSGAVGPNSMGALAKELRKELMKGAGRIKLNSYTIADVANRAQKFHADRMTTFYGASIPVGYRAGFLVFGYSSGREMAEAYAYELNNGPSVAPSQVIGVDNVGISQWGQPECVERLTRGFDIKLMALYLKSKGLTDHEILTELSAMSSAISVPMYHEAMPIQDAIELTEFLIETTKKYVRFRPGVEGVAGPVDIAAVTKHEGFKWIRRKHFYSEELNPRRE